MTWLPRVFGKLRRLAEDGLPEMRASHIATRDRAADALREAERIDREMRQADRAMFGRGRHV